MYRITKDLIPKGRINRTGFVLRQPYYITIHDTGNRRRGAGAINHARYQKTKPEYVNGKPCYKAWHYTVDDKHIIQSLPDLEVGYNNTDGNGIGNRNSISIEICMNPDSNRAMAEERASWLTAILMSKYNIPIVRVVQHNFWKSKTFPNGKNCPEILRGRPRGWEDFLRKVRGYLSVGGVGDKPLEVM